MLVDMRLSIHHLLIFLHLFGDVVVSKIRMMHIMKIYGDETKQARKDGDNENQPSDNGNRVRQFLGVQCGAVWRTDEYLVLIRHMAQELVPGWVSGQTVHISQKHLEIKH